MVFPSALSYHQSAYSVPVCTGIVPKTTKLHYFFLHCMVNNKTSANSLPYLGTDLSRSLATVNLTSNYVCFGNCWPNMHMWHVCSPKHTISPSRNPHHQHYCKDLWACVITSKVQTSQKNNNTDCNWLGYAFAHCAGNNQALAWSWGCCSWTQESLTSSNHVLNTHSSKNLFWLQAQADPL